MTTAILVYPKTGFDIPGISVDIPLCLLHLAAMASEHNVTIIDQRIDSEYGHKLRMLLERRPDFLGLSVMTGKQIEYALEITKLARMISPTTRIIWGGPHPTLSPAVTLHGGVDIVVRGPGEVPFKMLMDNADLESIPGVSYLRDGKYCGTPQAPHIDTVPPLPYEKLSPPIEAYIGTQGRLEAGARALLMVTALGCPYRCAYCATSELQQNWNEPVPSVLNRMAALIEKYNLNAIMFHDQEFLVNKRRSIEIAHGIMDITGGRANGFRWWCQTRMDSLEHIQDAWPLLWQSGLESFQPGIESGNDRILRMINKKETTDQYIRVNRALAETEFQPLYNFMIGFPTEKIGEMKDTLKLAVRLLEDNPHAMVSGVYALVPYPGTAMWNEAIDAGFEPPNTLEEWAGISWQKPFTPWLVDNPQALRLSQFASLTSRFIDGKRLPRRLNLLEGDFAELAQRIQDDWMMGDTSNFEIYKSFNALAMALYEKQ